MGGVFVMAREMQSFDGFEAPLEMPFNIEAEQSVLGALILDPDCITDVLQHIKTPEMFHTPQHKQLFNCLLTMYNQALVIDIVTFANESMKYNVFSSLPQANEYLTRLVTMVPSVSNVVGYCKIVADKYFVRQIMTTANDILNNAREQQQDAMSILDVAEQRFAEIRQGKDNNALTHVSQVVIDYYDRLAVLTSDDAADVMGVSSGFMSLDNIITGLNKSDLILIAARPGMGKTSFAINIATNVIEKSNRDVAVFSLEMSNEQLVGRIFASKTGIRGDKLKTGRLESGEWTVLSQEADRLSSQSLYLDDTADITVPQMKAKLRRMKNLGLVIIDYLQLMSTGGRSENRVQEISQITRSLKIMAKELNVPVILLSQLSRATEQRQGHRPMLSDLRESGSIEQDADIVMFLYREGYYNKECEYPNLAQCIVAKNRHGAIADADMTWCGERTTFLEAELVRNEQDY